MGSSVKKKKEKKKDFQVSPLEPLKNGYPLLISPTESKAEGRKDQGKARQFHGHELQGKVYVEKSHIFISIILYSRY